MFCSGAWARTFVIMACAKNDLRSFLFQYLRLHLLCGMCCYLFGADGGPEAGVCFLCLAINLFWPMSLEVDLGCVSLQKARLAWNEYRFLVSTNIMFRSFKNNFCPGQKLSRNFLSPVLVLE